MTENNIKDVKSRKATYLAEIGRIFAEAAKELLIVTLVGAVIGAVALGAFGGKYFGWSGLGLGILAGACIGALVFWWLYASFD